MKIYLVTSAFKRLNIRDLRKFESYDFDVHVLLSFAHLHKRSLEYIKKKKRRKIKC